MLDAKRPPTDPLSRLRDPSYVPADRELAPLFERLAAADDDEADALARALARRGPRAAALADDAWASAAPPLRARLVRLYARLARGGDGAERAARALLAALDDPDPKVRRAAAFELGKARRPDAEAPLLARWRCEGDEAVRRALAEALGKLGGPAALEALRGASAPGALGAALDRARLTLERTLARAEPSVIDLDARPPRPLDLVVHCRAGLERWLVDELGPAFAPHVVAPGTVRARLAGPPRRLLGARTMLWFGFPLAPEPLEGGRVAALARALDSSASRAVFGAFTRGPRRFRLAWSDGAHRRADAWALAAELANRPGAPQNDPSESPWEARAHERGPTLYVTLAPVAYDDPRFAYRRREVPGASHPTIAAALALAGGVRPDDVVWDPFCGSGLELAERGLLGPYRHLFGSDHDDEALDAAHANLVSAGLERFTLECADARSLRPPLPPSLVVTNPPFGRKVARGDDLAALYERFLENAARALAPGGRLVWITPRPEPCARAAAAFGLEPRLRQNVDMGGFRAEMQAYAKRG